MRLTPLLWTLALLASAVPAFSVNPGTPTAVEFEEPTLAEPGRIRAAIIADRTTGHEEGLPVLAQAVSEINEAAPDLVLTVGDMVNGYTRHEEDWVREFEEEWKVYADRLEAPLFPAAGNHDTRPGTRGMDDHSNEALYQEHFGPLYYSFDVEGTHFIMLYSDDGLADEFGDPLGILEEQLAWLREDLGSTDADHIFVLLHRPQWTSDRTNWDEVHELLAATGKVRAVIAGHNHSYAWGPERDGIQYVVMGVTGGDASGVRYQGGEDHWGLLTVEGDDWNLEIKDIGDEWLPGDFVLAEDQEMFRRIWWQRGDSTGPIDPLPEVNTVGVRPTEMRLRIDNPLDQEVHVTYALDEERQRENQDIDIALIDDQGRRHYDTVVGGRHVDRWVMEPAEGSVTLAPNSSQEVTVIMSHPEAQPPLLIEPQINFVYQVTDSRGREVPLTVRRRFMMAHDVRILAQPRSWREVDGYRARLEGWEGAREIALLTWRWATYETRELSGSIRIAWRGDDLFWVFARFPDDRIEDWQENPSDEIMSDALVLRAVWADGEERAIAIMPYRGERQALRVTEDVPFSEWPDVEGVTATARDHNVIEGMRLWEFSLPIEAWLGPDWLLREDIPANIERHDNDGTHWTAVRSWGPTWTQDDWPRVSFGQTATPITGPPEE